MKTATKLVLAAAGALLLSGYAIGQETRFTKKGVSSAIQKRDSARCWQVARKAKLTQEQANQNLLTGYLVGGVIGVLVVSAENEDANKNPKSAFRRQIHDECMARRGYRKAE
jgi:hypothetical protein